RLERLDVDSELDARIAATNADPDRLDELLEPQNYRLPRRQTAGFQPDHPRLFDVNSLVAPRMEDPARLPDTHPPVPGGPRCGVLDGVRIDHPDGLRDPLGYFSRLRAAVPRSWIVVEKILQDGEDLPERWPVAGSTGYDFAGRVLGLFVDPAGETALTNIYVSFTRETDALP